MPALTVASTFPSFAAKTSNVHPAHELNLSAPVPASFAQGCTSLNSQAIERIRPASAAAATATSDCNQLQVFAHNPFVCAKDHHLIMTRCRQCKKRATPATANCWEGHVRLLTNKHHKEIAWANFKLDAKSCAATARVYKLRVMAFARFASWGCVET